MKTYWCVTTSFDDKGRVTAGITNTVEAATTRIRESRRKDYGEGIGMSQYRYLRGSQDSYEIVEFDISKREQYITTCVVNVRLLLCGISSFPCGNGNDERLTAQQRLEILEFLQAERKKITDSFPVKTYEGWHQSGLPTFEDYCFPGDEVDEAIVEHFVNSVPPTTHRSSCTQDGEPFSHEGNERGSYRPTYGTFHRLGEGRWRFDGYCFEGKNENRVCRKPKIQQLIDEARREAEFGNA